MNSTSTTLEVPVPVRRAFARLGLCVALVGAAGMPACTTPPSVTPLLKLTAEALVREAELVEADRAAARRQAEQLRASLERGFDRDLLAQEPIEADWVREAVLAYTTAREATVRNELARDADYAGRIADLHEAASLQAQAVTLLEGRDALIERARRLVTARLMPGPPATIAK